MEPLPYSDNAGTSPRIRSSSPLDVYGTYVDELRALVAGVTGAECSPDVEESVRAALDGQAAKVLRRLVSLDVLRRDGVFLTSSEVARRAVQHLLPTLNSRSVILDPACGAGDLFLACLEALPVKPSLGRTLRAWEARLVGRDLHPELLEATRQRLLLAAIKRSPKGRINRRTLERPLFPKIRTGCGLSDEPYESATHLVMNPPFTAMPAPDSCNWSSGQVNSAAIFVEHALRRSRRGTRIAAILPDVLRSGSRYRKWRRLVESLAQIEHLEIEEQFDRWTDVHVFLLTLRVRQEAASSSERTIDWTRRFEGSRLGDRFAVRIGPVVDYRDPHEGSEHPFIHSRDLPPWGTLSRIARTRRFAGRLVAPPFVAVRRTSRPGDAHRAIGTLVLGRSPVAVENHVICLKPHRGGQRSCKAVLRNLRNPQSTGWLDQRIRCRHLTVRALADLPWWSDVT